jgi:hypothetical protein
MGVITRCCVVLTLLIAVVLSACAVKPTPPQLPPMPETWNVPTAYAQCRVTETALYSTGGWIVTLYCPPGFRLAGAVR